MYQAIFIWNDLRRLHMLSDGAPGDRLDGLWPDDVAAIARAHGLSADPTVRDWFKAGMNRIDSFVLNDQNHWPYGWQWLDANRMFAIMAYEGQSLRYPFVIGPDGAYRYAAAVPDNTDAARTAWRVEDAAGIVLANDWASWLREVIRSLEARLLTPLLLHYERDDRLRMAAYVKPSTYRVQLYGLLAAAWQSALANDPPCWWRQAEGELWLAMRGMATPAEFAPLQPLLAAAHPDATSIPGRAFWLALALCADKPDNYAAQPLVKPWVALLSASPKHSVIKRWLASNDLDCLALLAFSRHADTARKTRGMLHHWFGAPESAREATDALFAAARRAGACLKDETLTNSLYFFLKPHDAILRDTAGIWLEDSHERPATLAAWLLAGAEPQLDDSFIAILARARPGLGPYSVMQRGNAGRDEWARFLIMSHEPVAWLSWLSREFLERPATLPWLNPRIWHSLAALVGATPALAPHHRARLVALLSDPLPDEADPCVLAVCLPLFPATELDRDLRAALESAVFLLQRHYPHAPLERRNAILKALNSYLAIHCAACGHMFRWPEGHHGPVAACSRCGDPIIESAYGSFHWLPRHQAVNIGKQLPRLKQVGL